MNSNLVENIINNNLTEAKEVFDNIMSDIIEKKLNECKKNISAKDYTNSIEDFGYEIVEDLNEAARFKIVKARIRGGKIQRRKKVATQPGFTYRGGRLIRMSPTERRKRKMGQRRGKIKRRAKAARAMQKRKRSLRRRKALGA